MNYQVTRALLAAAIGLVLTLALAGVAYFLHFAGAEMAAQVVFWQNTLLQSLVPLHNVGTPEKPIYMGTPLNFAAFIASFPVGVVVYSFISYCWLNRRARKGT